jgi:transposase
MTQSSTSVPSSLDRIGVGIDTARYGHRVSFLRPDRQPAAKPITVMETQAGYQSLREQLERLHQQHPQAHFHIRIDAAGQYAANLERFLRGLNVPTTISIGEPKRNKDYQKAHFPKRTTDDTDSQAMARFAVVELPEATLPLPPSMNLLREVASRLQAQVKQSTQAINRLHNLLARVFPELAMLAKDFAAGWVLELLDKYPTTERIAQARLSSLENIGHMPQDKPALIQQAARQSVGSLAGAVAETLVRDLVSQVRHCEQAEARMRCLLSTAFADLPASGHQQLTTIPGIGEATAAVLTAKIIDINRFATADHLVGYFGVFAEENSSGVDKNGKPLPTGTMVMSAKGNDLVRFYLWNAACSGIRCNPALRALFARLKAKGKRGGVAIGHCMRKLLHLVFAVWKTNRPFSKTYFPWEPTDSQVSPIPAATPLASSTVAAPAAVAAAAEPVLTPAVSEPACANTKAAGHTRETPAKKVVTTAPSSVAPAVPAVNSAVPSAAPSARPRVDFAFVRGQVTMEQLLRHLNLFDQLRGRGQQRRGVCPLHAQPDEREPTLSIHLGKNLFHCFQAHCAAQGNVLDFWAAVHHLPIYEAALHLAETFRLPRNREEAPV